MGKYVIRSLTGDAPSQRVELSRFSRSRDIGYSEEESMLIATAPVTILALFWQRAEEVRSDYLAELKAFYPALEREELVTLAEEEHGFLDIWDIVRTFSP